MAVTPSESVTFWLEKWQAGADGALEQLTELLYQDLRRLAAHYLQDERPGHTLRATALVHEFYLRLSKVEEMDWKNRGHFISFAAQQMRRILIDHARKRLATKRDCTAILDLGEPLVEPSFDVLIVDQALSRMATHYPRHAQIVELRFFGGLATSEIASILNLSERTVERDWTFAKAWLQHEISNG